MKKLNISIEINSNSPIPIRGTGDYENLEKTKSDIEEYLEIRIAKFYDEYKHLPYINTIIYYDPFEIEYIVDRIVIYENKVCFFCELTEDSLTYVLDIGYRIEMPKDISYE